jgi:hypothetical protein
LSLLPTLVAVIGSSGELTVLRMSVTSFYE